MRYTTSKKVESAKEYKAAMDAADTLGLTLASAEFYGAWETADEEPVFLSGARKEIQDAGYTYFTTDVDGEPLKVRPASSSHRDDGNILLNFD